MRDTTVADFGAGALGGLYVSETDDGELMLSPAWGREFSDTSLDATWQNVPYAAGGAVVVGAGTAAVDGASIRSGVLFAAGGTLEFDGAFSGATFQHAGLATSLEGQPWAIFSTGSTGGVLYARTAGPNGVRDTVISGDWLTVPHRFRIEWSADKVVYSIDDLIVATHTVAISEGMRVVFSDLAVGSGAVTVNWARMTPYAAQGTFLSRVLDAGSVRSWGSVLLGRRTAESEQRRRPSHAVRQHVKSGPNMVRVRPGCRIRRRGRRDLPLRAVLGDAVGNPTGNTKSRRRRGERRARSARHDETRDQWFVGDSNL